MTYIFASLRGFLHDAHFPYDLPRACPECVWFWTVRVRVGLPSTTASAGAKAGTPSGNALAHDRAVSRRTHARRDGRSRPAECLLYRPGRWRRLEERRLRADLEP